MGVDDDVLPLLLPKYVPNKAGIPTSGWNAATTRGETLRSEPRKMSSALTPSPSEPVRLLAEWENMEGVLIAWPYCVDWLSYNRVFCPIVDELQDVGLVYFLINDSQHKERITNQLLSWGVPIENIEWLYIPYDSCWTRDYGPINIQGLESGNLGIVDNVYYPENTKDDVVNKKLHSYWNMDYYESPIVTEGGNMCTDGLGRLFCSRWLLKENPKLSEEQLRDILRNYLNVELILLPQPPISTHLDMYARLVGPETWIVGQWPPDDPNTPYMDELVAILESMPASTGKPYTIYRVQQPPGSQELWRTYTNACMQNRKVLVPIYGLEQDNAALTIFQNALPDYKVVGIDCNVMNETGGYLHCITQGIATHDSDFLLDDGLFLLDDGLVEVTRGDLFSSLKSTRLSDDSGLRFWVNHRRADLGISNSSYLLIPKSLSSEEPWLNCDENDGQLNRNFVSPAFVLPAKSELRAKLGNCGETGYLSYTNKKRSDKIW